MHDARKSHGIQRYLRTSQIWGTSACNGSDPMAKKAVVSVSSDAALQLASVDVEVGIIGKGGRRGLDEGW